MAQTSCKALEELTNRFHQLPGIGKKTAFRLSLYILKTSQEYAQSLADAIKKVKNNIRFCKQCYNITEQELCLICENPQRKHRGSVTLLS